MGPKYGTRPNEFKYGMALYGAAWPPGKHFFICGGGGHGLVPRLVWAKFENGACSDQVGEYKLDAQTPMRLAIHPSGYSLVLGNSDTGIRLFKVDGRSVTPRVFEVSAAFRDHLDGHMAAEVKALAFNSIGDLLAVGFADGALKVVTFPAMQLVRVLRLNDGVKDADFSARPLAAPPHNGWAHTQQQRRHPAQHLQHQPPQNPWPRQLLAATSEDGGCHIWDVELGKLVCQLQLPKGMEKARFARCRFARHGEAVLYTAINQARAASYLAAYVPEEGGGWRLARRVKVEDGPCSSVAISRSGKYLALGQTSGALLVFDALNLALVKEEKQANMVFITDVAFADDGHAAMAVGGDANCYVMELTERQRGGGGSCACLLVFLLLAALASVATWYVLATQPQRAEALRQWIEPILAHEQVQRVHQLTSDALRRFTDEL